MTTLRWAPRVPMDWIQRLYDSNARGIIDDELLDKVGRRLYARCRDCLIVTDAALGHVVCPACEKDVDVVGTEDERVLTCPSCGWTTDWPTFHRSWRHMEMCTAGMRDYFEAFLRAWERANTPSLRMLAIDDVIHRWHWENAAPDRRRIGRPGGVNLIEGSRRDVIVFLDKLTSGPNHDRWRAHLDVVERRR